MKSEGNVADLEKADERKMRYYAREVEQADRESKKARFVAPENTQRRVATEQWRAEFELDVMEATW